MRTKERSRWDSTVLVHSDLNSVAPATSPSRRTVVGLWRNQFIELSGRSL
jgi:hypothetical protein